MAASISLNCNCYIESFGCRQSQIQRRQGSYIPPWCETCIKSVWALILVYRMIQFWTKLPCHYTLFLQPSRGVPISHIRNTSNSNSNYKLIKVSTPNYFYLMYMLLRHIVPIQSLQRSSVVVPIQSLQRSSGGCTAIHSNLQLLLCTKFLCKSCSYLRTYLS